ncbi:MAG: TadE/TadG family type IV pilus assembly protein [Acidimicrobiia bacterium]|nr:TadE/TadG family type IV pilus assembly protein [Acidimicrobiia bacterium]
MNDLTRTPTERTSKPHQRERGAALIEAALVLPMLLMMLLGTVTASIAYGQQTSLQTAAREASRYGASLPVTGGMDVWLRDVLSVARNAAAGDLAPNVPGQFLCVAYVYPAGSTVNDRTTRLTQTNGVLGSVTSGPTATCFDDGRPASERRVQVVTSRRSTIQAIAFDIDVTLRSTSAARFERFGS